MPAGVTRPLMSSLTLVAVLAISASIFWRKPDTLGALLAVCICGMGCLVLLTIHSKMFNQHQETDSETDVDEGKDETHDG